jgi:hypothetical protein
MQEPEARSPKQDGAGDATVSSSPVHPTNSAGDTADAHIRRLAGRGINPIFWWGLLITAAFWVPLPLLLALSDWWGLRQVGGELREMVSFYFLAFILFPIGQGGGLNQIVFLGTLVVTNIVAMPVLFSRNSRAGRHRVSRRELDIVITTAIIAGVVSGMFWSDPSSFGYTSPPDFYGRLARAAVNGAYLISNALVMVWIVNRKLSERPAWGALIVSVVVATLHWVVPLPI